jgi:hypothetical protein
LAAIHADVPWNASQPWLWPWNSMALWYTMVSFPSYPHMLTPCTGDSNKSIQELFIKWYVSMYDMR